jgi:hypothetical protein
MRSTSEFFNVQPVATTLEMLLAACRLNVRSETISTYEYL